MPKSTYETGYRKPPKNGQFTKGHSGNPSGRPKGSKNLATIVLRESRQRVRVQGSNGARTVTKLEATVMQLQNKAAQGHLPSQRELLSLVRMSEEVASGMSAQDVVSEPDQQMLQSILRRMREIGSPEPPKSDSEDPK